MILICFFFIMQWASIFVNLSRVDKREKLKRQIQFRKVFCSIGLPSLIGLLLSAILLFTPVPWWVSVCTYILLSIIFAFLGAKLYRVLFKNSKVETENKKQNAKKRNSKKKKR